MISDYMFKHLHDFKSYEVVETKVDTLYDTPLFDKQCIDAALRKLEHAEKAEEFKANADHDERIMDIWKGSYYSRNEYKKAAKSYLENRSEQFAEEAEAAKEWKEIYRRSQELSGKEQLGWVVIHSYRSNTKGGNTVLGEKVFLMDTKFKNIMDSYDGDDDDVIDAVKEIRSIINDPSCNEATLDTLIASYIRLSQKTRDQITKLKL